MKEEVNSYPDAEKPDLIKATQTWRFPSWDWALKKPLPGNPQKRDYNIPLVLLPEKVHIRLPTILGSGEYPNAFHHFIMPGGIKMGG